MRGRRAAGHGRGMSGTLRTGPTAPRGAHKVPGRRARQSAGLTRQVALCKSDGGKWWHMVA